MVKAVDKWQKALGAVTLVKELTSPVWLPATCLNAIRTTINTVNDWDQFIMMHFRLPNDNDGQDVAEGALLAEARDNARNNE